MRKALLADDDDDSRVLLEAELIAAGFEVVSAENGQKAFDLIQEGTPPDIIISDAMMSGMDGFELCRTLKADPRFQSIPFIFYSATYVDARDEQLALSLGAARYIIKPVDMPRLIRIIESQLDSNSHIIPDNLEESSDDTPVEQRYSQVLARKLDKKVRELERERDTTRAQLRYLQEIDAVSNALSHAIKPEDGIRNVLRVILEMFEVDRAWLLYPCDPDAPSFTVPMAVTTDDYPGAETEGDQPIEGLIGNVMRDVLQTDQPVVYETGHPVLDSELLKHFQVQSQIITAIRPKEGKAWQFGLHQCRSPRQWTDHEKKLFKDISLRMSDTLASVLYAKELAQSEQRNRVLVENAPEAIVVLNAETGFFVDANENALTLFGLAREELLASRISDVSPLEQPDGRFTANQYVEAALRGEKPVFEWNHINARGEVIPTEIRLAELPSSDHRLIRGSITDVSEKIHLQKITRQQELQLLQANKMSALGTLVAGVAHELNNPNHLISINAGLLSHFWTDIITLQNKLKFDRTDQTLGGLPYEEALSAAPGLLEDIGHATSRIQKIVSNLRDFSRPTSSNLEPTDLNEVISLSVHLLGHVFKHTPLEMNLSEDLPKVSGNTQALQQIITNLVMNALDALPAKGGHLQITSQLSEDDKRYIDVRIVDNGSGISENDIQRIAEPFFTTKRDSGGTGLGLAICYSLVREHKGELIYASEASKGTTVTLRLPILL